MIDVKRRCRAAWAQLDHHYGIAIMTHHLACRTPALTGEVTPVLSTIIPLPPAAVDPDKGQEQRPCVGATYYPEGWHAAKIRSPPSAPQRPGDRGDDVISAHRVPTVMCTIYAFWFKTVIYFVSYEDKLNSILHVPKQHKTQPSLYFLVLWSDTDSPPAVCQPITDIDAFKKEFLIFFTHTLIEINNE